MMSRDQEKRGTIIWIDPWWEIIDAVVKPLESLGYQIIRYTSVQEASRARNVLATADIILLELMSEDALGDYTGTKILRELQQNAYAEAGVDKDHPALQLLQVCFKPVIVLTTEDVRRNDLLRFYRGVQQVIRKPVKPSVLKRAVLKALGHI